MKRMLCALLSAALLTAAMVCTTLAADTTGNVRYNADTGTYSVTAGNVISGNDYILLVAKGTPETFALTEENILYIDQATAHGNSVRFDSFKPKAEADSVVLLGGKLANNETSPRLLGTIAVPRPTSPAKPAVTTVPDVPAGVWYHDAVVSAVENKLFSGLSDGSFAPDMKMNRAMMVTVLAALQFGEAGAPATSSDFTDLTADWYKNAAAWAAANKITSGVADGKFAPQLELTREQVAAFLYAFASYKGIDVTPRKDISTYRDASGISAWAYPAMQWACAVGLMDGTPDGLLLPTTVATRAQTAVILNSFSKLING